MESSGKTQDSRGAYSPVTVPITSADEKTVKTKPGTQNQHSRKKCLLLAGIVGIIIVIIILIIAIVASKGKDKAPQPSATMGVPNITQATTTPQHTTPPHTTPQPGPTTPPLPGSFNGSVLLNKTYNTNYDDVYSATYRTFTSDFISSMDSYYSIENFADVYNATVVNVLLRDENNGNVEVRFTISLFRMDMLAKDFLHQVQTLAGYNVLNVKILS